MTEVYDIIVVGGGPGGLAAGLYGSRSRLKTAIIEKGRPGGQAATTEELENYPGFFEDATGPGLMKRFAAHAEHFGSAIIHGQVTDLVLKGVVKKIITKDGQEYQALSVILAPGAEPRSLNIPGEHRLRGKGVSYCATCDADFFEELDIVVVGNGDAAIEEAMYLTKFAETVTIIVIHDEGVLDCNKASAEKAFANDKIKWIWNSILMEINGDELVESVTVKNIKTGQLSQLDINGVFFFVGTVPKTAFLQDQVDLTEQGYIITNDLMETNIPGVYAAGDARDKYLRQVITAAADGAIAAVAAEKYLAEQETFRKQVLDAEKPVLLVFWAPQVEESFAAVGIAEEFAAKNNHIDLVKLDTYRNKKTAANFNISQIPSILLFEKGEVAGRLTGKITAEHIINLLHSLPQP
ncbi:MAG: thioredoxin-disulfide reductase [Clostridiales bacterium]|nr:thioredoxin-disulfide reductase [Clostridiales bacterium]